MLPLESRYLLISAPRSGAVGRIWTARDQVRGEICVLKLAPSRSPEAARLEAEATLLSELAHPRLIPCLDRVRGPDAEGVEQAGFSMPWKDAARLDEAAASLDLAGRVRLLGGLVDALGYLHARGVLHLDLKPSNILVDEQGPILLDLGTAARIDEAPARAGGTLGYAAPEVLQGEAPTLQADLFGLGVVAYELFAGRLPFTGGSKALLRQDVLRGEVIPLRAAAPEVPRPLAQLLQGMLAVDPLDRPAGIGEVWEALKGLGFELPSRLRGAPPLLGRQRELETLLTQLREDRGSVVILGERGTGRDRLARAALWRLDSEGGDQQADLSGCADPLHALTTLLTLESPSDRTDGESSGEALAVRLQRPLSWRGRVYVGHAERLDPAVRSELLALQPALRERGVGLLWAATTGLVETRPFYLGPLGVPELRQLGQFLGISGGRQLRERVELSRGLPGALMDGVILDEVRLSLETERSYRALCTLPAGTPLAWIRRLGPRWQAALRELSAAGLAHTRGDGGLMLLGAGRVSRLAPEILAELGPIVDEGGGDPVWRGLFACRRGRMEEATALVEARLEAGEPLTGPGASELLERVAVLGRPRAAEALCQLRVAQGDLEGALAALELAPDPSHLGPRMQVLQLLGRREEALALLQSVAPEARDHAAWVQAAWALYRGHRFKEFRLALDRAEALAPGHPDAVALHLIWFEKSIAERDRLAAAVLEHIQALDVGALPYHPLFTAGRILMQCGEVEAGARWMEQAANRADAEGNLSGASITRMSLGTAMMAMGRERRARRALNEGLVAARAAGIPETQIRGLYSLGELEIRTGRLDVAERVIRDYIQTAATVDRPDVRYRGWILRCMLAERRGQFEALLRLVDEPEASELPVALRALWHVYRAAGLLGVGRAEEALEWAQRAARGAPTDSTFLPMVHSLVGRCHLAVARAHLKIAREKVPDEVGVLDLHRMGQVLLAAAGEELEPMSFEARRADLDRAARMLRGPHGSRAATLRDRLLTGPGAGLQAITELLEMVHDPREFPKALARLVSEALGAHRVLIMMRIPGLGRQVGVIELGQQEVAGIGEEVLRRIRHADDVWLEGDAFADPAIRQISATVRSFEIRSVLAVAIPQGEHALGALYVDDLHRPHRFSEGEVALMKRLARAASHLIGMMSPGPRPSTTLEEPRDLLGVLLADARHVEEMQLALDMLRSHQDRPVNLLITGATGTGKTWLARRITREILGCAADPVEQAMRDTDPDKLITALAGTRRGEFTGAVEKQGAIRKALAARTSLFFDEIQALDDRGQTTLLPLLELPERRFSGLTGEAGRITEPLCVILGTNVDVSGGRWRQHFRQDLWFRMSQVHIHLPTLAERGPEVVYRYLAHQLAAEGLAVPPEEVLEPEALRFAVGWSWPGNLRELVSAAQEIAFFSLREGRPLTLAELKSLRAFRQPERVEEGWEAPAAPPHPVPKGEFVEQVWRVLPRYRWNQSEVARVLGCSVSKVNRALKGAGLLDEVRVNRARMARS